jgi:hypothetical protein
MADGIAHNGPSREQLIHTLYEAAELEHNLMCTYLYAAFSLKSADEGLSAAEVDAVSRWRRSIIDVAIEEMGHLSAVWNITAALGGQPRFGRGNFPLDPGYLPAGITVKLEPFNEDVLQHFIFLERPEGSEEPEGKGFEPQRIFKRVGVGKHLTPMAIDYETAGVFYQGLGKLLRDFSAKHGESAAFAGDPALQMSPSEIDLGDAKPVLCLTTALHAFDAIVTQGEGASADSEHSHFHRFAQIRDEYRKLKAANPEFEPAWPAAVNPVLRRPPSPERKVWLENADAVATVDLAHPSQCHGRGKAGGDRGSLSVRGDQVPAQRRAAGRGAAACESMRHTRERTLCGARRHRARRQAAGLSHDALPVRGIEEQALLRQLAP